MMNWPIFKIWLPAVLLSCFLCRGALALTIDEFAGSHDINAHPGETKSLTLTSTSSIGRYRTLSASGNTGLAGLSVNSSVEGGVFNHSQDAGVTGSSMIVWDGDSDNLLNFTGLGGIDLTQDGATALRLEILFFDLPNNNPVPVTITLYDASDPSGNKSSAAFVTLAQPVSSVTVLDIPFSDFTVAGVEGAASSKNIGAVILFVSGALAPAVDLTLDWVGTNGECRVVPDESGRVIDVCGVCAGDGKSCLDCAGAVFGTASLDQCGVCGGDGKSCLECKTVDITELQTDLDGGAKVQEKLIKRIVYKLGKVSSDAITTSYIASTKSLAHSLQIRNWVLSWKLPSLSTTCENLTLCVRSSNDPLVSEYRTHSQELLQISYDAALRLEQAAGKSKTANKFRKSAERLHNSNMKLADQVPADQFYCT